MGGLNRVEDSGEENASMIVTCYVERCGDDWEGICTDFNLAVQGHSFREIEERLDVAIHDYLRYVESLPENERVRFMNRRSSFATRLAFASKVFISEFSRRRHKDGSGKGWGVYTVPCMT